MSTVNLCDRCGTMGKSKAMGTVVIVPVNEKADVFGDAVRTLTGKVERMELCPGCVGELMAWKDAEGGTRPKAYSEPWEPPKDDALPTDSTTLFRLALEASKRETFGDEKSDD